MKIDNLKKFLITNYHNISPEIINNVIEIELYNNKKMKLNFENRFIKYFPPPKDITIIEIMPYDEIYNDIEFLNYDLNYINGYEIYQNVDVFIIGFPLGKNASCSSGRINEIDEFEFFHSISTEKGSSGSPVILLNENINLIQVIGIHKSYDTYKKLNCGTFIGEIVNIRYNSELNNENNINKKIKNDLNIKEPIKNKANTIANKKDDFNKKDSNDKKYVNNNNINKGERKDNIDIMYKTSHSKKIKPNPNPEDLDKKNIYKEDLYNSSTVTSNKRSKYDETEKKRTEEEEAEEQFLYRFQYNQGDKDLEPYFAPRVKKIGGNIKRPELYDFRGALGKALRNNILSCTGIKLYSALLEDDWKMREAAVTAFIEFIENPLPTK